MVVLYLTLIHLTSSDFSHAGPAAAALGVLEHDLVLAIGGQNIPRSPQGMQAQAQAMIKAMPRPLLVRFNRPSKKARMPAPKPEQVLSQAGQVRGDGTLEKPTDELAMLEAVAPSISVTFAEKTLGMLLAETKIPAEVARAMAAHDAGASTASIRKAAAGKHNMTLNGPSSGGFFSAVFGGSSTTPEASKKNEVPTVCVLVTAPGPKAESRGVKAGDMVLCVGSRHSEVAQEEINVSAGAAASHTASEIPAAAASAVAVVDKRHSRSKALVHAKLSEVQGRIRSSDRPLLVEFRHTFWGGAEVQKMRLKQGKDPSLFDANSKGVDIATKPRVAQYLKGPSNARCTPFHDVYHVRFHPGSLGINIAQCSESVPRGQKGRGTHEVVVTFVQGQALALGVGVGDVIVSVGGDLVEPTPYGMRAAVVSLIKIHKERLQKQAMEPGSSGARDSRSAKGVHGQRRHGQQTRGIDMVLRRRRGQAVTAGAAINGNGISSTATAAGMVRGGTSYAVDVDVVAVAEQGSCVLYPDGGATNSMDGMSERGGEFVVRIDCRHGSWTLAKSYTAFEMLYKDLTKQENLRQQQYQQQQQLQRHAPQIAGMSGGSSASVVNASLLAPELSNDDKTSLQYVALCQSYLLDSASFPTLKDTNRKGGGLLGSLLGNGGSAGAAAVATDDPLDLETRRRALSTWLSQMMERLNGVYLTPPATVGVSKGAKAAAAKAAALKVSGGDGDKRVVSLAPASAMSLLQFLHVEEYSDLEPGGVETRERHRLMAFYAAHAANKLGKVAHLINVQYKGRVQDLFAQLEEKYISIEEDSTGDPQHRTHVAATGNTAKDGGSGGGAVGAAGMGMGVGITRKAPTALGRRTYTYVDPVAACAEWFVDSVVAQAVNRRLLSEFYALHDPSKLAKVDYFLEKYAGREQKLFTQLAKIYKKQIVAWNKQKKKRKQKGRSKAQQNDNEEDEEAEAARKKTQAEEAAAAKKAKEDELPEVKLLTANAGAVDAVGGDGTENSDMQPDIQHIPPEEGAMSEAEALFALYTNTRGTAWNNRSQWVRPTELKEKNEGSDSDGEGGRSDSPDLSGWHGVGCDSYTYVGHRYSIVTSVVLMRNSLRGPMPGTLHQCKYMRRLVLAHNRLTGQIPPALADLKTLKVLDLSHNEFGGAIPRTFGAFKNLQVLRLHKNRLQGTLPADIGTGSLLLSPRAHMASYIASFLLPFASSFTLVYVSILITHLPGRPIAPVALFGASR